LILILKEKNDKLRDALIDVFQKEKVEYRRGLSGGGNQLRQPYLKGISEQKPNDFPVVDHIHFYSFYLGNYPSLDKEKIELLAEKINMVVKNG